MKTFQGILKEMYCNKWENHSSICLLPLSLGMSKMKYFRIFLTANHFQSKPLLDKITKKFTNSLGNWSKIWKYEHWLKIEQVNEQKVTVILMSLSVLYQTTRNFLKDHPMFQWKLSWNTAFLIEILRDRQEICDYNHCVDRTTKMETRQEQVWHMWRTYHPIVSPHDTTYVPSAAGGRRMGELWPLPDDP